VGLDFGHRKQIILYMSNYGKQLCEILPNEDRAWTYEADFLLYVHRSKRKIKKQHKVLTNQI